MKYACNCCGYLTLDEMPPGTFDICPVCFWEDEFEEDENTSVLGPNPVNLAQARRNFEAFGASAQRRLPLVRKPLEDEFPGSKS